jgi:hypothetical protein
MVLTGLGVFSVMGLVLKIPAPTWAITIRMNHQRLIGCKEGQIVISMARTLAPQQKKANRIIQPKRPISYSLIMRQDGSSSRFRK